MKESLAAVLFFFKSRPVIGFLALLIGVYFYLNFHKTITYRPQSIHQWAQCDRGSIARNFAEESMNFFLPRVHNCRNLTGITGLEFPIMNYTVAIFYKIFGFSDFWYRLVMLLTMSAGLTGGFTFAFRFLKNFWLASGITLLWFLSPILNYYTPNFVPDTASLSFALLSWVFFFKAIDENKQQNIFLWALFACLATLVKVTSGVSIIAVIAILFFDRVKWFGLRNTIPFKLHSILLSGASFILVFAWYAWSSHITDKYGAKFFAAEPAYPKSFSDIVRVWEAMKIFHLDNYYSYILYGFHSLFLIFIIIFRKKLQPIILITTTLLFMGCTAVMALFFMQFIEHDYYIIVLLIPFFFLLLAGAKLISQIDKKAFRVGATIIIFCFVGYAMVHSRHFQKDRYSGWMNNYDVIFPEYWDLEKDLRSIGITRDDKVVSLFDYSTNITLYMMNQKGWILYDKTSPEGIEEAILDCKYAVVNDLAKACEKRADLYFKKQLGKFNGVYVFELSHTQLPTDQRLSFDLD